MTIHEELSSRTDELWAYWTGLGPLVNSTLDVERIARRELMARYLARGKPEALIPLLDWTRSEEDISEIDTVAQSLAERRKFDAAGRLWERTLKRLEKEYWEGDREFRRRHPPGGPDGIDLDGQRVFLYERTRCRLALGYNGYLNLINIYASRKSRMLAKAVVERRRRVFAEAPADRPVTADDRAVTEEVFWELMESVGRVRGTADDKVEALGDRLRGFRPKEILQFGKLLRARLKEANTWDLWGAAYLLNSGCSDDGFLYFRAWLVLQGRGRFEKSTRIADSLARWARSTESDPAECESLLYVADEVYEEVTGKEARGADGAGGTPKGRRWKEEELPVRLPRLWKVTR